MDQSGERARLSGESAIAATRWSGILLWVLLVVADGAAAAPAPAAPPAPIVLQDQWLLQSATLLDVDGDVISSATFMPVDWYPTSVPATVLNALVHNGVIPANEVQALLEIKASLPVPEPSMVALLITGAGGALTWAWRRRRPTPGSTNA